MKWNGLLKVILASVVGIICCIGAGQYSIEASENTVIDCTGLVTGPYASCYHVWEHRYTSTNCWLECTKCSEITGYTVHSLESYGVTNNCSNGVTNPGYRCSKGCGYSYETPERKKKHVISHWEVDYTQKEHTGICGVCGEPTNVESCTDSMGRKLGCGLAGTCVVCGKRWQADGHTMYLNDGKCEVCEEVMFTSSVQVQLMDTNKYRVTFNITKVTGSGCRMYLGTARVGTWSNGYVTGSVIGTQTVIDGKQWVIVADYTVNDASYVGARSFNGGVYVDMMLGGKEKTLYVSRQMYPDGVAPQLNVIWVDGNGQSIYNWSRSATVNCVVSDSWQGSANNVYMRMLDSRYEVITEWKTATRNGTTYSSSFDIVQEIREPSTIIVEVMDACGNHYYQGYGDTFGVDNGENRPAGYYGKVQFSTAVQYIDSIAPKISSVGSTGSEWSKNKPFSATCVDQGIGEVSIAFNSESQYKSTKKVGNNYNKQYTLTGDVYGKVTARIYYRDKLGNVRTGLLDIKNLDNTAPTIYSVEQDNENYGCTVVKLYTHDRHASLGEGSGAVGWYISKEGVSPTEDKFKGISTFSIKESGRYYAWAIDRAGNISNRVEFEVYVRRALSINPNGGQWNGSSNISIVYGLCGETKQISNPTRDGYGFKDWTIIGGDENTSIEYRINDVDFTYGDKDAEIRANWIRNTYLTFDLNGGTYKGSDSDIVIQGCDLTESDGYVFGIYNNPTEPILFKRTAQIGSIDCYGEWVENGINTDYNLEVDGVRYRFLGWSTDENATEPDDGMCIYENSRKTQYTVYSDTTLYAVWEPELSVDVVFSRTLDNTKKQATGIASRHGYIEKTSFRTSEHATYGINVKGNYNSLEVIFDSNFEEVYLLGNNNAEMSKYLDTLNNHMLDINTYKMSHELQINEQNSYEEYFYIPTYILEYQKFKVSPTSINEYTVVIKAANDNSVYYRKMYGTKEEARVTINIGVGDGEHAEDKEIKEDIIWEVEMEQ